MNLMDGWMKGSLEDKTVQLSKFGPSDGLYGSFGWNQILWCHSFKVLRVRDVTT